MGLKEGKRGEMVTAIDAQDIRVACCSIWIHGALLLCLPIIMVMDNQVIYCIPRRPITDVFLTLLELVHV